MALNVVCCKTAIRLKSGAQRKWPACAQNVADDPTATLADYFTNALPSRVTTSLQPPTQMVSG